MPSFSDELPVWLLLLILSMPVLMLLFRLVQAVILTWPPQHRLGRCSQCGHQIVQGDNAISYPGGKMYCSQRCERHGEYL